MPSLIASAKRSLTLSKTHLQSLPRYRTPDYEVRSAKVSAHSTINVRCVVYTVPSRLIDHRLTLHLYHDRLVGFLGTTQVVELERGSYSWQREDPSGTKHQSYRHVAESLRRKPKAFLHCQWQSDLLPNDQWHTSWQTLKTDFDRDKAARLITEALYLAATQDQETQVAEYLQIQLEKETLTLAGLQRAFDTTLTAEQVPDITSVQHNLSSYDELLQGNRGPALPNIDEHPQTTPAQTLPGRMAEHRAPSDSRELVLCSVPPWLWHRGKPLAENKIGSLERYQKRSLPYGKSWTNFDFDQVPTLNAASVMEFAQTTHWMETGCNILIFGPSGTGKTHVCSALGRSMIELGKRVKFVTAVALVQQLQLAKLQLELQTLLSKLDRYDLLIVDDLGYVKKSDAETSVLFELIAHRYERKSLLITANQPFSQWDAIFPDSMMTVAAIDRLIHHATIIEMNAESFRKQEAAKRTAQQTKTQAQ